jgi:hypothetical protein
MTRPPRCACNRRTSPPRCARSKRAGSFSVEQDGRVVRLHPTALALEHREQQEAAWGEALARALDALEPRDAAQLRAAAPALSALAAALAQE